MADILVPSPGGHIRLCYFREGVIWRPAIVDAQGHLQIDVLTSGLPAGAATAVNQALILAQVQAIEDLTHALQSVATDRLIVRGEDQLHSYDAPLGTLKGGVVSGADGYYDSNSPPAGGVWVVTNIRAVDATTATTFHAYILRRGGVDYRFDRVTAAMASNEPSFYHGWIWMEEGDVIRVSFWGSLAGDWCEIVLVGHGMDKET